MVGALWFRQESKAILIADMDGLRSSLCLKGSAGLKPCLRCLNVVKKDSGLDADQYPDICVQALSRCRQATDQDIWSLADALLKMVDDGETKAKIQKFEKSSRLSLFSRWFILSIGDSRPITSYQRVCGWHALLLC